jgi:hypothetical protein
MFNPLFIPGCPCRSMNYANKWFLHKWFLHLTENVEPAKM